MKKWLKSAMMAAVVGFAAISTEFVARSATEDEVADAGNRFVQLLVDESFAVAVSKFDPTMKEALPEDKLRQLWNQLGNDAGRFKWRLGTRVETIGKYRAAFVTCRFSATALDVKVVFDFDGNVAGLFFLPSTSAVRASPPPYANTNAFQEKEFIVGRGQWRLPGTLTLPNNAGNLRAAVVLVHGSGPLDRDETVAANKPFRDLAWGLASGGIAVLRYEKRTWRYPITNYWKQGLGQFTVKEETIDDVLKAVAQLRTTEGIDPRRVFVLGHSMGGELAPRIGQSDPQIAGLIILAGSIRPYEEVIVEQTRYIISLDGKPSADGENSLKQVEAEADKLKKLSAADASSQTVLFGAPPAYWLDLRQHDPLAAAKEIKQPMLLLQGGRDYQVTTQDFKIWKRALGSPARVSYKSYPKLNHLFIAGEGKSSPAEYEQPGNVDGQVVADIGMWISKVRPP